MANEKKKVVRRIKASTDGAKSSKVVATATVPKPQLDDSSLIQTEKTSADTHTADKKAKSNSDAKTKQTHKKPEQNASSEAKRSVTGDKKDKKRKQFSIGALQEIYDQLAPMSDQARMDAFDLKPDRADVIVPAARIFLFIAQAIHAEHIYVPVIGLSDGIIDSLYAEDLEKYNQKACRDAGTEALAAGEDAPCQDCGCDAEPAEAPVPTATQSAPAVPAAGCAAPKRTDVKPAAE